MLIMYDSAEMGLKIAEARTFLCGKRHIKKTNSAVD